MHHPRFSSGHHSNDDDLETLWETLYDFGTEVVLSGHDPAVCDRYRRQKPYER